jgi:hypothetical protein
MNRKRVETLGDLRCRCAEVGECWEWQKSIGPTGTPSVGFLGTRMSALRAAYMLHHRLSQEDMAGVTVWAGCKNQICINPAHALAGLRADMLRWRGDQAKRSPAVQAVLTMARKKRGVMFTMEEARQIRLSTTSEIAEAERRGCSPKLIGDIRRGNIYRETVAVASVFALGALALESA